MGGCIFANYGTNRSKGLLTLINPKYDANGDRDGRLLGVKVNINNETVNIRNVYAPNITKDRQNYQDLLERTILEHGLIGHNNIRRGF